MNNGQLKELVLQTNYLLGGYQIIIDKIKNIDNYEEIIPAKLRIDATLVLDQIKNNLQIIEDIVVPDEESE